MESIGPYRLDSELGHGAMGVVFRAFDPVIGRAVAIKIIRLDEFATANEKAEIKLRFAREATAAGKLSHPNIVTVYHLGSRAIYNTWSWSSSTVGLWRRLFPMEYRKTAARPFPSCPKLPELSITPTAKASSIAM